jgi:hypothetical protein
MKASVTNGNPDIAHQVMGNKSEADECSHNHHAETTGRYVTHSRSSLRCDHSIFGFVESNLAGLVHSALLGMLRNDLAKSAIPSRV